MHVNRKKLKFTHINPGAGHYGMHDGYGDWDKTRHYRVLGILVCKKHLSIPKQDYSDFSQCYTFTCKKCEIEEAYVRRLTHILEERKKGRLKRIQDYKLQCEAAKQRLDALKECYS